MRGMVRQADFAISLQPNEVADLTNIGKKYFWWSGWRRRHWPADILRPGLRLYGFDKVSRCFVAVLEVTRCGAFKYRTGAEFRTRVRVRTAWYPYQSDPHWESVVSTQGRIERIGINTVEQTITRKLMRASVGDSGHDRSALMFFFCSVTGTSGIFGAHSSHSFSGLL